MLILLKYPKNAFAFGKKVVWPRSQRVSFLQNIKNTVCFRSASRNKFSVYSSTKALSGYRRQTGRYRLAGSFFVSFLEKQKRKEARGRHWEVAKQKAFTVKLISFIKPQELVENQTAVTLLLFHNKGAYGMIYIFLVKSFALYLSIACRGLFFFFLTKRSKSQGLQKKKLPIRCAHCGTRKIYSSGVK